MVDERGRRLSVDYRVYCCAMRRRPRRLLLALATGLAVNLAVATGCALFSSLHSTSQLTPALWSAAVEPHQAHIEAWSRFRVEGAPTQPTHVGPARSGFGVTYTKTFHTSDPTGVGDFSTLKRIDFVFFEHVAAGWPLVAMEGGRSEEATIRAGGTLRSAQRRPERNSYSMTMFSDAASSPAAARHSGRQIPLMPRWPGFIGNTVIYALVVWIVFAAFVHWRSAHRIMRGRCIRCGYDLAHASHSSCPECGAPKSPGSPAAPPRRGSMPAE